METVKFYSIFDDKTGVFKAPFAAVNDQDAQRKVIGALLADDSLLSNYPKDFHLYYSGEYSQESGVYASGDFARHVCSVDELVAIYNAQSVSRLEKGE